MVVDLLRQEIDAGDSQRAVHQQRSLFMTIARIQYIFNDGNSLMSILLLTFTWKCPYLPSWHRSMRLKLAINPR